MQVSEQFVHAFADYVGRIQIYVDPWDVMKSARDINIGLESVSPAVWYDLVNFIDVLKKEEFYKDINVKYLLFLLGVLLFQVLKEPDDKTNERFYGIVQWGNSLFTTMSGFSGGVANEPAGNPLKALSEGAFLACWQSVLQVTRSRPLKEVEKRMSDLNENRLFYTGDGPNSLRGMVNEAYDVWAKDMMHPSAETKVEKPQIYGVEKADADKRMEEYGQEVVLEKMKSAGEVMSAAKKEGGDALKVLEQTILDQIEKSIDILDRVYMLEEEVRKLKEWIHRQPDALAMGGNDTADMFMLAGQS